MKPKVVAIIVITILALSMVLTIVAAIGQAVSEDFTETASGQYVDQDAGDGRLVRAFKFVCPFH